MERWDVKNQIVKNIWYYAVSVALVKKLGVDIELHTDNIGKEFLDFLPYDKIHKTLENFDFHKDLWASNKMEVYKHLNPGDIHIDGDVFIKKQTALDALKFDNYDCIFQMEEGYSEHSYRPTYNKMKHLFNKMLPFFSENYSPINCGVAGFNNMELKHDYIDMYFEIAQLLLDKHNELKNVDLSYSMVVLEQWFVWNALKKHNAKIKFLLPIADCLGTSRKIGYTHIMGSAKYKENVLQQVKDFLKEFDINLYNHIVKNYE